MTFRDGCKIEVSTYKLSPQVWHVEVSILRVSNGEALLARITVREPANIYRNIASALEAARAYVEAMIASGEFNCSPALN